MVKTDIPTIDADIIPLENGRINNISRPAQRRKLAIIIGADSLGITAAYELLNRTDILPILVEKRKEIGRNLRSVNYKGNRIDIIGDQFCSNSIRVTNWLKSVIPTQRRDQLINHIGFSLLDSNFEQRGEAYNNVLLTRQYISGIYSHRKFLSYPYSPSLEIVKKIGLSNYLIVLFSYIKAFLGQCKQARNIQNFLIDYWGEKFYSLFIEGYWEKYLGDSCHSFSLDKDFQVSSACYNISRGRGEFLFPKLGPGQLWQEIAAKIIKLGGPIPLNNKKIKICSNNRSTITTVSIENKFGKIYSFECDYLIPSVPLQDLVGDFDFDIPFRIKDSLCALRYRDSITVCVLLKGMSYQDPKTGESKLLKLKDTCIYISEKGVKVAHIQLFNNWSPFIVNDPGNIWIGMEFFCQKDDSFWKLNDSD